MVMHEHSLPDNQVAEETMEERAVGTAAAGYCALPRPPARPGLADQHGQRRSETGFPCWEKQGLCKLNSETGKEKS